MSEDLLELLLKELREAVAARIPDGTDPDEMTAELAWRLRRIRQMHDDDTGGIPDRKWNRGRHPAVRQTISSDDDPGSRAVIENHISTRIHEALTGRTNQRPFVEDLSKRWTTMAAALRKLLDMLDATDRSVRQSAAVSNPPEFRNAMDTLLHGAGADGRPRLDRLQARIYAVGQQLDAARARVHRDTVNIGVIGGTRAGKSTLLRTITNLPETVVPSTRFNPTTAVASRIYHTDGASSATLSLHTWESFRDQYLAPLHAQARLGTVPWDIAEFRSFRYPATGSHEAAGAKADDFLRKLHAAQTSLHSYQELLLGADRELTVDFAELRPYVAYPREAGGPEKHSDPLDVRPYHAVRSVRIEQRFPDVAARLGLIDLPGAGEAGLDIDRQFLQQVKNEIDLLLMVKRASPVSASYLAEDSYTRNLADSTRGGAPLEDYYMVVVNRDVENDASSVYSEHTVASVTRASQERNIRVLAADVVNRDEVLAKLLKPLLEHLATRLAEMDRAVIREALTLATAVADEVAAYAEEVIERSSRLANLMPDQEGEFLDLAKRLRDDLAYELLGLVDRYDRLYASGEADSTLAEAITEAVGEARTWVRDGLGRGSRDEWMRETLGGFVAGELKTKQDEYYRARTEITRVFGRIDLSLDQSVQRLWDDAADVLRGRLTGELVPPGPDALQELRATAEARRAAILAGALRHLCALKGDYGSVALRVTQPIIRGIHWDRAPAAPASAPPPRPTAPAPAAPPAVPPAGQPASAASSSGWERLPNGEMRRVSMVSMPTPPGPDARRRQPHTGAPGVAGGEQEAARITAEGLYDELTAVVEHCVTELETALRNEARVMTRTLAAASDRFFESAIRTVSSERDYAHLCRPNLRSIWPDKFGGNAARLAVDLSRLQEQARSTVAATTLVTGLSPGMHPSRAGASTA